METSAKLYSLNYSNVRTYLFALLFVTGNIALPQICHLVPYGGPTLLPIYFFTLIAAYKIWLSCGITDSNSFSCHQSPVICNAHRELHSPIILIKSALLAGTSALAARTLKSVSLWAILGVVLSYQIIGTAFEWAFIGNFHAAVQDFRIGIPGMLIQWFGGYALLKAIAKL